GRQEPHPRRRDERGAAPQPGTEPVPPARHPCPHDAERPVPDHAGVPAAVAPRRVAHYQPAALRARLATPDTSRNLVPTRYLDVAARAVAIAPQAGPVPGPGHGRVGRLTLAWLRTRPIQSRRVRAAGRPSRGATRRGAPAPPRRRPRHVLAE